jgi:ParB family chromosome partitioning protein
MSKRALGKGIGALLGEEEKRQAGATGEVALSALRPNPDQPRKDFADARLRELADSIRQKGVLQPVLVEEDPDGRYTIIAGERRFRAAKLAGLDRIPVIVGRFAAAEKLEIALIENVQREDLTPIEEAQAYRQLMDMASLNQEQVAAKVGKDRSTVANSLRLLKLPEDMQQAIGRGDMSPGHPHCGQSSRPGSAFPSDRGQGDLRQGGRRGCNRHEQGEEILPHGRRRGKAVTSAQRARDPRARAEADREAGHKGRDQGDGAERARRNRLLFRRRPGQAARAAEDPPLSIVRHRPIPLVTGISRGAFVDKAGADEYSGSASLLRQSKGERCPSGRRRRS